MNDNTAQEAFRTYLKAFAVTSSIERDEMIRASVAEDIVFSNPGVDGHGVETLLAHIVRFQEAFPGGRFRVNWLRQQHGQVLAEWAQLNGDGSELVTAHSYARMDETGRIAQFAGFWEAF